MANIKRGHYHSKCSYGHLTVDQLTAVKSVDCMETTHEKPLGRAGFSCAGCHCSTKKKNKCGHCNVFIKREDVTDLVVTQATIWPLSSLFQYHKLQIDSFISLPDTVKSAPTFV